MPRSSLLLSLLAALVLAAPAPAQTKRPLTHADDATWRSIRDVAFAHDGSLVAYSLVPPEGDAVLVVRRSDGTRI